MIIRESDAEVEVSGSSAELRAVAVALTGLRAGQCCQFMADGTADPAPYTRTLAAFQATATGGPVCVSVAGGRLIATGGPEMLARLASFFEFGDADEPGVHRHHEWWEGNEYIAVDSRPTVIILC